MRILRYFCHFIVRDPGDLHFIYAALGPIDIEEMASRAMGQHS